MLSDTMILKKSAYFCVTFDPPSLKLRWPKKASADETGCSAARLAHLVWDQRVAGSNPATPTKEKAFSAEAERVFVFLSVASLLA